MSMQPADDRPLTDVAPPPGEAAAEPQIVQILPAPGADDEPAPRRRGLATGWLACSLLALAGLLVTLGLGTGGGFYYQRSRENRFFLAGQSALEAQDWVAAEAAFSQALTIWPMQARVHALAATLGRGRARYELGSASAALEDFGAVLALDESQAAPYYYKMQIHWRAGNLEAALEAAAALLALDDTYALPYALQAYDHYLRRDYGAAETAATAALARDDQLALAYRVRGSVHAYRFELEPALDDLNRALALAPEDVEALAQRVSVELARGDQAGAAKDADAALAVAPEAPAALWAQALVKRNGYAFAEARALIDRAIALDDGHPEYFTLRGKLYDLTADEDASLAAFERALELDPDYGPAIAARAWTLNTRGRYEGLQADGERLIELYPLWPEGHYLMAAHADAEEQDAQELEHLEEAIALQPEAPSGYVLRGYHHLDTLDYAAAMADFERARALDLTSTRALMGLATATSEQNQVTRSLIYLGMLLALNPQDRDAMVFQAYLHYGEGRSDMAWERVNSALGLDPDDPRALVARAHLHSADGDNAAAFVDLDRVLRQQPDFADAYTVRAGLHLQLGDLDRARADAEHAVELEPDASNAYLTLAMVASEAEDWQAVIAYASHAIEHRPLYGYGYSVRAIGHLGTGDAEAALADLASALALDPSDDHARYLQSLAHRQIGDVEAAIRDLEQYLDAATGAAMTDIAESELAFLRTVPQAFSGRRTLADLALGYYLSYDSTWVQQPNPQPTPGWVATLWLAGQPRQAGVSILASGDVAGYTLDQLIEAGDASRAALEPSYQPLALEPFERNGLEGMVRTYQTVRATPDGDIRLNGQQYYFLRGPLLVMFIFEAAPGAYTQVLPEVEALIGTLRFGAPQPTAAHRVVFDYRSDEDSTGELYVISADGLELTRLTVDNADDFHPVWSPDGSQLAFVSNRDGNWEIYVMNPDGTGRTRLTTARRDDVGPVWSPDGSEIVFFSDRDGGDYDLYRMNADGSHQQPLTLDPADDYSPAWSPDGQKIAFFSDRDGNYYNIYVMNADGTDVVRLTEGRNDDSNPAWSPDGRHVVFDSTRNGASDLYLINADGSGLTQLTSEAADDYAPAWSPDGQWLAYISERDGNPEVYLLHVATGYEVRLTNDEGLEAFPSWAPDSPLPSGFYLEAN